MEEDVCWVEEEREGVREWVRCGRVAYGEGGEREGEWAAGGERLFFRFCFCRR